MQTIVAYQKQETMKKNRGKNEHSPFQLIQKQTGQGLHKKWQLLVKDKKKKAKVSLIWKAWKLYF